MKKLFEKSLDKLCKEIGLQAKQKKDIIETIKNKYQFDISYKKLNRLPEAQLRTMLKIFCPVDGKQFIAKADVLVFKRMRHKLRIQEGQVCGKCPFRDQCQYKDIQYPQIKSKLYTQKKAIHDLLFFFLSLQKVPETQYSGLRWLSAYKIAESLLILIQDIEHIETQSLLYQAVMKTETNLEFQKYKKKRVQKEKRMELEEVYQEKKRNRIIHLEQFQTKE